MTNRTKAKGTKPAAKRKGQKGDLLAALAAVKPAATRQATDPIAAILTALDQLAAWAKTAPFVVLRSKAQKEAAAKAGVVDRKGYLAIIAEARTAAQAAKSIKDLYPLRESVGQRLYFGARTRLEGAEALVGKVGFTRKFAGAFEAGPKFAGTFASRAQKPKG